MQYIIITTTTILNLENPKILVPANYWRTQKYRCWQNIQNIGASKIHKNIGAGKYLGVDKLLALTKHRRIQNLRVDKILASTKHRRLQILAQGKVGGDAEELPFC